MLFDRLGRGWAEFKDRLSHLRALVVDDEEIVRSIVSEILRDEGFEVEQCADAASAWQKLNHKAFDLLVTDKNLPDQSGLALIAQVKHANLDVPSAVITGYASIPSIAEAFDYGAADYIAKPFDDIGQVARRLKSIAERRVAERLYRRIINDLKTAMTSSGADRPVLDDLARELSVVREDLLGRPALMVVDPDPVRGGNLAEALRQRGLSVLLSARPDEAAQRLHGHEAPLVALISLDIPRPSVFVFEARAAQPLTEIVVTRDHSTLAAGLAAVEAGASDFVDNSIENAEVLVARVRRLVELARSQRLHVNLIAALYRRVRERDPETGEAMLAVLPADQRRYLESLAPPQAPTDPNAVVDLTAILIGPLTIAPPPEPGAASPGANGEAAVSRTPSGRAIVGLVAGDSDVPRADPALTVRLAELGERTAEMVHEIRQPLLGIKALAQMILRSEATSIPMRERVQGILDYSGRVEIQLARTTALIRGEPSITAPSQQDLNPLVDAACRLSRLSTPPTTRIEVEVGLDVPPVLVDPDSIQQILVNLLNNAKAAIGPTGGRILVKTRRIAQGAEVSVEDDGPGVPTELWSKIFEPFVTTKADGTGLGLSLSRRLAEAAGGTLELVDSRRGALFCLRLPGAKGQA